MGIVEAILEAANHSLQDRENPGWRDRCAIYELWGSVPFGCPNYYLPSRYHSLHVETIQTHSF